MGRTGREKLGGEGEGRPARGWADAGGRSTRGGGERATTHRAQRVGSPSDVTSTCARASQQAAQGLLEKGACDWRGEVTACSRVTEVEPKIGDQRWRAGKTGGWGEGRPQTDDLFITGRGLRWPYSSSARLPGPLHMPGRRGPGWGSRVCRRHTPPAQGRCSMASAALSRPVPRPHAGVHALPRPRSAPAGSRPRT